MNLTLETATSDPMQLGGQNWATKTSEDLRIDEKELEVILEWVSCGRCNRDITLEDTNGKLPLICTECQGKLICRPCYKVIKQA